MPTYTYECKKCGSTQDEFHLMSATPAVKCTSCGSTRMRRRPGTGSGIIFKGSGFYETDYKRNGANGSGSSGDGAKTESKSEGAGKPSESSSKGKPAETKATAAASK